MKINLYMDVQEGGGVPQYGFGASSQPGAKIGGYIRVKITAEIPDYVIYGRVDLESPEVKVEVLDD